MKNLLPFLVSLGLMMTFSQVAAQQALTNYIFDDNNLSISLVDIDGDNDMDVFVGADAKIYFLENVGDGMYTDMTAAWEPYLPKVNWQQITIDFTDIDGDGDFDMSLLGDENSQRKLYMNDGNTEEPQFNLEQDNPLDDIDISALDGNIVVGNTDAVHSWADLDNDGDEDFVIGGKQGWFLYFENIGNNRKPKLVAREEEDNPFKGLRVAGNDEGTGMQYESSPYLVDIDVDGDYDLFSGNQMGTFHYYENVGSAEAPVFEERFDRANPLAELSVMEDSKVAISDQDCDGIWEAFYSGNGEKSIKVTDLNRYQVKPIKVIVDQDQINIEDGAMPLQGGYPVGGVWSGEGVKDGMFYPEEVGQGYHRVTYSVVAYYGCELTTTEIIEVGSEIPHNNNLPNGVIVETKANTLSIINPEGIMLNYNLFDNFGRKIESAAINSSQKRQLNVPSSSVYIINVTSEYTNYAKKIFLTN